MVSGQSSADSVEQSMANIQCQGQQSDDCRCVNDGQIVNDFPTSGACGQWQPKFVKNKFLNWNFQNGR